jgi:hypothetical protein
MAKESTPQTLWVGKVATVLQYSMQTLFSGSKENGKRIKIPNHSGLESGKVGAVIRQLTFFLPQESNLRPKPSEQLYNLAKSHVDSR